MTQQTILKSQGGDPDQLSGYFDESTNLFTINLTASLHPHFKDIFKEIDKNPSAFNIKTYNLRVTSLEEVFNTIGEQEHLLK